jgi:hypothetical protein
VAVLLAAAMVALEGRPAAGGVPFGDAVCFGEPATIVSVIHGTVVLGTGGRGVNSTVDDVVHAGSGNDTVDVFHAVAVYGESGDDYLQTNDSLLVSGGSGNNTLNGLFDAAAKTP